MKLVVGLGNPGKKYEATRHNVGFILIGKIVGKLMVSPHAEKKLDSLVFYHHVNETIYARPQTFMNNSGVAVKKLTTYYKVPIDSLYIIHDDLDIALGEYKIQKGKGPRVHYGIKSIEESLGDTGFWRVRIGIENRDPENRIPGEAYVLQAFTIEERATVDKVLADLEKLTIDCI